MKLQQLRYVWEVAHHNLNVSATAQSLYTSQPGISKQIRLLEDELGIEIFTRSGKHFTQVTPAGEKILKKAGEVLRMIESIKQVSQEFYSHHKGTLAVAATYVHARYQLSQVIGAFTKKYPEVALHLYQGNAEQVISMVVNSNVDFAITADNAITHLHNELLMIPCYRWKYSLVVPVDHPLSKLERKVTIEDLKNYPLITYVKGGSGRSHIDNVFIAAGIQPRIVFTAADADVIKTYIKLGLGVGIIAKMAYDKKSDNGLVCIDASHLISSGTVHLCLRSGSFLRGFMLEFIELCASRLTKERLEAFIKCENQEEVNKLFNDIKLPEY